MLLDDVLARLGALPERDRAALVKEVMAATPVWVPTPGPQFEAYFTEADEAFYGGEAGGGKTDLAVGLAITAHKRSLILRRYTDDAREIARRAVDVLGSDKGFNRQLLEINLGDRLVEFGGCQYEEDKQRFKGKPHDLIVFDEGADFTQSQYEFITTWNRSVDPDQRCRILVTSNPPTSATGLWVIERWAPWVDHRHPNPARSGEIRWFLRGDDDVEREVDGPGPHPVGGEMVRATSRTFIRARLSDNPYLRDTDYASRLALLPPELRAAYRDGRFDLSLRDGDHQLIPTAWVQAAQARWNEGGDKRQPMTCMALDPAGGGRDTAELARRHGGWFAPLITMRGPETADGSMTATTALKHRRNGCPIVLDVGGGYASGVIVRFEDNAVPFARFNGAGESSGKTRDGSLGFANKRAEAWWRFRDELDPDQDGGSAVALPPDPELLADLTTPTWKVTSRGILIESKDDIRKRIGRSPGKGDAVVMAAHPGSLAAQRFASRLLGSTPRVIQSREAARRRR
jgi:hypothetical protein